jgi:hypothetical protein
MSSNSARITTLTGDMSSNSARITTLTGDMSSNSARITTLTGDMSSNSARITNLDTKTTDISYTDGTTSISGNLTVLGNTTTLDTVNLIVQDPILQLSNASASVDLVSMIHYLNLQSGLQIVMPVYPK